jgi:formylglycine-generating enzyme required for sulfatase activity
MIPSGEFLFGDARRPARTGAYEIDLVEVTVARFAQFIDAGGYRERGHWSDAGWNWRSSGAIDRPRFWGDPDWQAYLGAQQPVVGVSFFEAEAWARWSGRRLPTELEWERAARGEDGREYPWGERWDPTKAHFRGNARQTLPVGSFPGGVSPHGLLDAAGNVWEWCADAFDGNEALRAARGGAWNAHPPQLRCASRNAWPLDARFSNIGFRTAR